MLSDEILHLRALEPADIDTLLAWDNMDELWDTSATLAPYSRRNMAAYIRDYDADPFHSGELRLMAEETGTGIPVGYVELYNVDVRHRRASAGVLIAPGFQRNGYGLRALGMLESYCASHLFLHQILAIVPVYNEASLALFRKLGFTLLARLPEYIAVPEKPADELSSPFADALLLNKILTHR